MRLTVRIEGDVLALAHGVDLFHGVVFGGRRWDLHAVDAQHIN
jgi:hypothetical protein